ncbi:MAG: hypothetical protein IPM39_08520 [Chloroflexi bacterium]|nr:hypothetical protein [Chloroflexota bacterium]
MTEQETAVTQLCHQYQVQILYVFGSRAKDVRAWVKGETAVLSPDDSDVDIGVKTAVSLTVRQKVLLTQALESLFGVPRVDLVILNDADPFLAANVIRGEQIFADDEYLAAEYDLYVLRRAGDLIPLERERQQLILQAKR